MCALIGLWSCTFVIMIVDEEHVGMAHCGEAELLVVLPPGS